MNDHVNKQETSSVSQIRIEEIIEKEHEYKKIKDVEKDKDEF